METLSSELLHAVCSLLTPRDAQIFRLVNRSFAKIGLEYIVPIVRVFCLPESFERLNEIANHPVLSQHVRHLVFVPSVLSEFEDKYEFATHCLIPEFVRKIKWAAGKESKYKKEIDAIIKENEIIFDEAWQKYMAVGYYYHQFLKTKLALEIFNNAFNRFTRLEGLAMGPMLASLRSPAERFAIHTDPFAQNYKLESREHWDPEYVGEFFVEIFKLLSDNLVALKEVTIEFGDFRWMETKKSNLDTIVNCLAPVGRFSLVLEHSCAHHSDSRNATARRVEGLQRMVTSPTNLQELEIIVANDGDEELDQHSIELKGIIGSHQWSRLRKVDLYGVWLDQLCFPAFLELHSATLKALGLNNVACYDPTVGDTNPMLEILLQCRNIQLDELALTGYLECPWKARTSMDAIIIEGKGIPAVGVVLSSVIRGLWLIDGIDKERSLELSRWKHSDLWVELVRMLYYWEDFTLIPILEFTDESTVIFAFPGVFEVLDARGLPSYELN